MLSPEMFCIKSTSDVFNIMEKSEIGKYCAEILPEPIREICNLAISHGISNKEIAKLKPIFKKGKKADSSRYCH